MKFFDYKFLLLLGLSIVIYFIYKEVENIKMKLEQHNNNTNNNNNNNNNEVIVKLEEKMQYKISKLENDNIIINEKIENI